MSLRLLPRLRLRSAPAVRHFRTTPTYLSSAGYGDPQDEKADNHTPTASSTPDPQPGGQGKPAGTQTGSTDPEVATGNTGSAGGQAGAGGGMEGSKASDIRETKKIGEDPKLEQVNGEGPIGG